MKTIKDVKISVLAMAVFALTAFMLTGCRDESFTSKLLRIGLTTEPETLNIWLASDRNSRKILSQIYQPLYSRNPDTLEPIPWLAAEDPVYDEENIAYTVKLRPAKWSDGSPFTSDDVAFTVKLVKEFKIPRRISRWRFVTRVETPDEHTVKFYLKSPKAIFVTRSLTLPIVQRKEWEKVAAEARTRKKPLKTLMNHDVDKPVGTGPFVIKEWREGAYLLLARNEHFFGTGQEMAGRVLGPHVEEVVYKIYGTSDVAVLALKKGSIDMFWWGIQPGYIDDLEKDPNIRLFHNEKSALYFMGFNVRRPPFDDVHLRRAVATLIDKEFVVSRILQGHGTQMDSIVPAENQYWSDQGVPRFGDKMNRQERVKAAFEILSEAGYSWEEAPVDAEGNVGIGQGIRLPGGEPMARFTILTPPADYDPLRAMCGMLVQEWLRDTGMPAYARPMSFSSLLQQVKSRREFDAFILGYGNLSLDPDYLRVFFYSKNDKPRGWNMSGYRNPDFDRIAKASASAMERSGRQKLIRQMQQIVIGDVPYIPIYKPSVIEAVRKDRFEGWVETLEGIGNIWSLSLVRRVDQGAS